MFRWSCTLEPVPRTPLDRTHFLDGLISYWSATNSLLIRPNRDQDLSLIIMSGPPLLLSLYRTPKQENECCCDIFQILGTNNPHHKQKVSNAGPTIGCLLCCDSIPSDLISFDFRSMQMLRLCGCAGGPRPASTKRFGQLTWFTPN